MVMPAYYLPRGKKGLSLTALLAIIVGVVVLISLVVVAVLLMNRDSAPAVTPQPIVQEPAPVTTPTPQVTPEPVAEPEPTPTVPAIVLPTLSAVPLPGDTDTDQDGLTDVEELIFLTSAAVPDTDTDSFLDGNEVKSLYDPATPRALLEVSPQVKLARNESFGYQLLIPTAWSAAKNTADGSQFMVRPGEGGESFRIDVYVNDDRATVAEWYQRQAVSADLTQFVNFSNEAGFNGIQSSDHTIIIAALDDSGPGSRAFIFVMHYDAGQEPVLRYRSIWDMIANSLAPIVAPIPSQN